VVNIFLDDNDRTPSFKALLAQRLQIVDVR